MAVVQAKKAQDFHNSVGIVTHLGYSNYSNFTQIKANLLDIGIRHVRDNDTNKVAQFQELAASGIKINYLVMPWADCLVPNSSYAVTGSKTKKLIVDFIKNELGASVLGSVECVNELDLAGFHVNYKWSEADQTRLNNDSSSPYWWNNYISKFVPDLHAAMKADPVTQNIKIVAPSNGVYYSLSNQNPMMLMGDYVDYGCGHYYEEGGHGFSSNQGAYGGITNYYLNAAYPGHASGRNLTSSDPAAGEYSNPAIFRYGNEQHFQGKPMFVTECGFHTGNFGKAINYSVHGKYMPRMFVEYFRLGFVRSFSYEYKDQGSTSVEGSGSRENSFGLVKYDHSYKPAATQLKALLDIIKETSTDTRTTIGSLDYTLTYTMPTGYTTRPLWVRQVLLQKADGTFILLVYHNIANARTLASGPSEEVTHPDIPATITFPVTKNLKRTTLLNSTVVPTPVTTNNTTTSSFNITDTVTAIEISPVVSTVVPQTRASIDYGTLELNKDNMLDFGASANALPTIPDRSLGTRIILRDNANTSQADYAIGTGSGVMWFTIPAATSNFRVYALDQQVLNLNGNGLLSVPSLEVTTAIPWIAITLLNSWTNFGGTVWGTAAYRKLPDGTVAFKGLIKKATAGVAGEVLFTLPAGYRPLNSRTFLVASNNGVGNLDVLANGDVEFRVGSNVAFSLDGLRFGAEQ